MSIITALQQIFQSGIYQTIANVLYFRYKVDILWIKKIYEYLNIITHRKYHWCVQYYHRVYVQLSVRVFVYNTNDISLFKVLRRFEVYLMYDNILIDYSPALVPLFLFNQLFYYLHSSVVYGWYGFSQYCHKNEWTPTWYFRFCIIIWYVCFS